MAAAPLSLTARALRLLAQREHSRLELERKLQRFVQPQTREAQEADEADGPAHTALDNAPPEDLAAVLDKLEAKGFIQPERVAQSVLYRRAPKLGSQRVLQELRQKGLDEAIVRQAAETLRDSEHQRAWAVWQRKFGQPAATPQERARQMRFLASRGFAMDVIGKVVRGMAPLAEE
ncbi:regulatory protein RecX [Comamonas nitrativorans]|uniref:Regulatory protein RecX n=1 Tax=Comamonas nitrativorans TaxID=108437 RepID=A0ABV9GW32_9BURK